jgi:hypothetical protein
LNESIRLAYQLVPRKNPRSYWKPETSCKSGFQFQRISVLGGDTQISAVSAAISLGDRFEIEGPGTARPSGNLGGLARGLPQTAPYKWWNWHDNYDAEASPLPKWLDILTDPQGAALRMRDEEAKAS